MQAKPNIFLFTALAAEAKPIIAHFALKKDPTSKTFAVFSNADYYLTVTGLGKAAMAAGVAYTLALFNKSPNPILLNLGIAGHKNHELGQVFAAEKILDADSGKHYYPQLVYDAPCPTATLCSVAKAQQHYTQDYLYDMEASAFYEAAIKFSSAELIQCLKIISDNRFSPATLINEKQVKQWLTNSIPTLARLIQTMTQLTQHIGSHEPVLYDQLLASHHFTISEQVRLKNLLLRWQALADSAQLDIDNTAFNKSKDVLHWLEKKLQALPYCL